MIHYKTGVNLSGLRGEILFAIIIADQVNIEKETWITSLNDGKHKEGSFHYKFLAVDLRSKDHLDPTMWYEKIKRTLAPQYQVIFEDKGGPNEHIHIEYDPPPVS